MVGQDQVDAAGGDGFDEAGAVDDPLHAVRDAGQRQVLGDERRVDGAVLEQEDADRGRVGHDAWRLPSGPERRSGFSEVGGGSFRIAQNTPRSWIASKKSLKPTGFTTKAFTPSS